VESRRGGTEPVDGKPFRITRPEGAEERDIHGFRCASPVATSQRSSGAMHIPPKLSRTHAP